MAIQCNIPTVRNEAIHRAFEFPVFISSSNITYREIIKNLILIMCLSFKKRIFMNENQLFTIFEIQVSKPFEIQTVLEILKKQMQYKNRLEREENYTEEQAFEEVEAIYATFFSKMSEGDRQKFENLHKQAISISIKENGINTLEEEWQISELYSIPVSYPFNRKNVREILVKEKKTIEELVSSGLTQQQAELDIQDLIVDFYTKIGKAKALEFSRIYTEEQTAEIQNKSALDQKLIRIEAENQIKAINNYSVLYILIGICLIFFIFFALASR